MAGHCGHSPGLKGGLHPRANKMPGPSAEFCPNTNELGSRFFPFEPPGKNTARRTPVLQQRVPGVPFIYKTRPDARPTETVRG